IPTMLLVVVSILALTIKPKARRKALISRPAVRTPRLETPARRRTGRGLAIVGARGGGLIDKARRALPKLRPVPTTRCRISRNTLPKILAGDRGTGRKRNR